MQHGGSTVEGGGTTEEQEEEGDRGRMEGHEDRRQYERKEGEEMYPTFAALDRSEVEIMSVDGWEGLGIESEDEANSTCSDENTKRRRWSRSSTANDGRENEEEETTTTSSSSQYHLPLKKQLGLPIIHRLWLPPPIAKGMPRPICNVV